jgi:hypothetical protein
MGFDARAIEIFLELESAYLCVFDTSNHSADGLGQISVYSIDEIDRKLTIIR